MKGLSEDRRCSDAARSERNGVLTCWVGFRTVSVSLCLTKHYTVKAYGRRGRIVEVEVDVNLRLTISRPVCSGVRRPPETCDQFFFLLEISFGQLRVCYFVAPSLTRGRACITVQLLLGLARAVTFGSKSRRTHGHILLSHLRLP
jgi:hypothetical protein